VLRGVARMGGAMDAYTTSRLADAAGVSINVVRDYVMRGLLHLLRHYWILFKLLLTAVATAVLLMKLGPVGALAESAADAAVPSANLLGLRMSMLVHAGGGLLILLAIVTLAGY